jgi:hypothetical protein
MMDPRFASVLGQAVVETWGELPQDIQQAIFEKAVAAGGKTAGDESLREALAQYLHDIHPRTTDHQTTYAPDHSEAGDQTSSPRANSRNAGP